MGGGGGAIIITAGLLIVCSSWSLRPVNAVKIISAQSINLVTLFLSKLSPLSG